MNNQAGFRAFVERMQQSDPEAHYTMNQCMDLYIHIFKNPDGTVGSTTTIWEVFYLPHSVFFLCSSTFDGRHSLSRFPPAGSVTQQENEIERCDWLERKVTTFCIP